MDSLIQTLDDHQQKKMKADATGERPMQTVGVYLKKERESSNLSLREVARLTKISVLYLECIEKDDFEKIPKGPYVKGYISSYSRTIGADTAQALNLYESANEKNDQTDVPQPAMPPVKGWKASVTTAFTSLRDWFAQKMKRTQSDSPQSVFTRAQPHLTPSLLKKRKASIEVDNPTEMPTATSDRATDNRESSVLIPFNKFAPTTQASNTIDASLMPAEKTDRISPLATALSIYQKIRDFLKVVGLELKSLVLDLVKKCHTRLPQQNVLAALSVMLLGVTALVFSGIGVYHVFFFDKQAPALATETTVVTVNDSAAAPASPSKTAMPHKASRLKKPDRPLPAPTIVATSPPPARSTATVQPLAPMQSATDRTGPVPEAPQETTASTGTKATQPADTNVKVLKAAICSAIKNRMPDGIATVFPLSVKQVYVWSHVQTEQYPTVIRHLYYHEGQLVNQVELGVRSPFWRTWSYKSIDKDHYHGHWRVDITANDNTLLRRLYFEIN